MNKGFVIARIIILAIIGLILIGLLVNFIAFKGDWNMFGTNNAPATNLVQQKEFNLQEISNLKIDMSVQEVIVVSADSPVIRVEQYSSKPDIDNSLMNEIQQNGSSLSIRTQSRIDFFGSFWRPRQKLIVYLPSAYAGDFDASISVGSLNIQSSYTFQNLNLHTTTGEIRCDQKLIANAVDAKVTTGEMKLGVIESKSYTLKSTTGKIAIDDLSGQGSINVTTGEISAGIRAIAGDITMHATTGSLNLTLLSNVGFEFTGKRTVGDINVDFPYQMEGNTSKKMTATVNGGGPKMEASVTTGDIRIRTNHID